MSLLLSSFVKYLYRAASENFRSACFYWSKNKNKYYQNASKLKSKNKIIYHWNFGRFILTYNYICTCFKFPAISTRASTLVIIEPRYSKSFITWLPPTPRASHCTLASEWRLCGHWSQREQQVGGVWSVSVGAESRRQGEPRVLIFRSSDGLSFPFFLEKSL